MPRARSPQHVIEVDVAIADSPQIKRTVRKRVHPNVLHASVKDIWMYPFTDCALDLRAVRNSHIDLDDVLRASGAWHALRLSGLRIGSPWLELAVDRARVQEELRGGVGILDTRQGVDSWRRALPNNMRDTIRKARARVASFGKAEFAAASGVDLPAAYEQFVALEASGWKGAQGTAISQQATWGDLLGHYLEATSSAQVRSLYIGEIGRASCRE